MEQEASRRGASAGRPQSWGREGEGAGHPRGLRAGHVCRGGTRERGSATCLLDAIPGVGDRVTQGPGAVWALRPGNEPCGETTNAGSTHGIGKRAACEATREGPGGSRSVAEYRRRWGTEAQGTHGREGDVEPSVPRAGTRGATSRSPTLTPARQWTAAGSRGSA